MLDTVSPATQVGLPAKRFDGTEMTGEPVDDLLQHPKSPVRRASGGLTHLLLALMLSILSLSMLSLSCWPTPRFCH